MSNPDRYSARAHPSQSAHLYAAQQRFLEDGGAALAAAYPHIAGRLARMGEDPDVERLLEGLAYLVGQVTGRIEEWEPLLIQLAFDLYFPHYLSPQPACSVVQFVADNPVTIPRGAEVRSLPVEGTPCRFTTAYDVEAGPMRVERAEWHPRGRGGHLDLHWTNAVFSRSDLAERTRVFLHAEPAVAARLYHWLTRGVTAIEWLDKEGRATKPASTIHLRPVGFEQTEALFPYPDDSVSGLRLLHEYLAFPQKFHFVDLLGLAGEARRCGFEGGDFGLRFHIRADPKPELLVEAGHFRLGCSPAANVFPHTSDPIDLTATRRSVEVRPAGQHGHQAVYRVLGIVGRSERGDCTYPLLGQLSSFAPEESVDRFSQIVRMDESEGGRVVCALFDKTLADRPVRQTLMADLLCTNARLPLGLAVGDLCHPPSTTLSRASHGNELLRCRNITAVTPPAEPPDNASIRPCLVAHMALASRGVSSLHSLRELIVLYEFRARQEARAARQLAVLTESLRAFDTKSAYRQISQDMVPVVLNRLMVDEGAFGSEGELFLFGTVLAQVLAHHVGLNQLSDLELVTHKKRGVYRWPERSTLGTAPSWPA